MERAIAPYGMRFLVIAADAAETMLQSLSAEIASNERRYRKSEAAQVFVTLDDDPPRLARVRQASAWLTAAHLATDFWPAQGEVGWRRSAGAGRFLARALAMTDPGFQRRFEESANAWANVQRSGGEHIKRDDQGFAVVLSKPYLWFLHALFGGPGRMERKDRFRDAWADARSSASREAAHELALTPMFEFYSNLGSASLVRGSWLAEQERFEKFSHYSAWLENVDQLFDAGDAQTADADAVAISDLMRVGGLVAVSLRSRMQAESADGDAFASLAFDRLDDMGVFFGASEICSWAVAAWSISDQVDDDFERNAEAIASWFGFDYPDLDLLAVVRRNGDDEDGSFWDEVAFHLAALFRDDDVREIRDRSAYFHPFGDAGIVREEFRGDVIHAVSLANLSPEDGA